MHTGRLLKTLKGHNGSVESLVVNGDKIISGSADETIKIWDLKTGKMMYTIHLPEYSSWSSNAIESLAMENGKIIAGCSDKTIKIWQPNWKIKNLIALKKLYYQINHFSLPADKLNLKKETVYKYGKIGEVYVPSVSYTSSTPQYSTVTIGSTTYNKIVYTSQTHTSSGYNTDISGYTAINRITNNNDEYYLVKVKSTWKGKYSHPYKGGSWGGDERVEWESKYKNGKQISSFLIPPHKYVKYQFVVGEEKAPVKTQILSVFIVPKEYAEKLYEALDPNNEALVLIDAFLNDDRVSAWHDRLKRVKQEIIDKQNKEFNHRYKNEVKVGLTLLQDYDPDFGGDVTLTVKTPKAMCVEVDTPFGAKEIQADGTKEVTFKKVRNLSKNPTVLVKMVKPYCN